MLSQKFRKGPCTLDNFGVFFQIPRLNAAAESGGADKTVAELRQTITDLNAEVAQWRQRSQEKEEEFKTSERDLRRRVMDAEKKTHETWVGCLSSRN